MTLIQLESFLRTAETQSFTKAAEKLYVSRQVISAHVKALEKELDCALFRNLKCKCPNSVLASGALPFPAGQHTCGP